MASQTLTYLPGASCRQWRSAPCRQRTVYHRLEAASSAGWKRPRSTGAAARAGLIRWPPAVHPAAASGGRFRGWRSSGSRCCESRFLRPSPSRITPGRRPVEQVHHIAMGLFHFIEQHHAVGAFAHRLGQDPARRSRRSRGRTFSWLMVCGSPVLGEIDGDQRFLAAEQRIGPWRAPFPFCRCRSASTSRNTLAGPRSPASGRFAARRRRAMASAQAASPPTTRLPRLSSRLSSSVCSSFISERAARRSSRQSPSPRCGRRRPA